jgi:CO/xanthine dehydrogenase Mo-binding subunit
VSDAASTQRVIQVRTNGDEDIFVGEPDRFNPIGVKGVGEIGLVGIAAIANAVFHATGRRIRSLPMTIDRLLTPFDEPPR